MNKYGIWQGTLPASAVLIVASAALAACGSGGGSSGGNPGGGASGYAAVEAKAVVPADLSGSDALEQAAARYLMTFRAAELAELMAVDFEALLIDALQEADQTGAIACTPGAVQVSSDSGHTPDHDPFAAGSYDRSSMVTAGCRMVEQDGSITELSGSLSGGRDDTTAAVSFLRWGAAADQAFDMTERFDDEQFQTRIAGTSFMQQTLAGQDRRSKLAFRATDRTPALGTTRFALNLDGQGGSGEFQALRNANQELVAIEGRIALHNDGGEHGECQLPGRYEVSITDLDGLNGVPQATLSAGGVAAVIEPAGASFSVMIGADTATFDVDDAALLASVDACITDD